MIFAFLIGQKVISKSNLFLDNEAKLLLSFFVKEALPEWPKKARKGRRDKFSIVSLFLIIKAPNPRIWGLFL